MSVNIKSMYKAATFPWDAVLNSFFLSPKRTHRLKSCPKCGEERVSVQYYGEAKEKFCKTSCGATEHLHLVCPLCLYWWRHDCLDKK